MIDKSLADKLTAIACKMVRTCVNFRQPRLDEVEKNFTLYANKKEPALKGRFNVPIPIVGGFVDTLMAKIDDPPKIAFGQNDEADFKKAKKVTAAWDRESQSKVLKLARKDRNSKKYAALTGRAVLKYYADSFPDYAPHLEITDLYDFIFEPMGGSDLDNHLFCGQMNIFRSDFDLDEGVKNGIYDPLQTRLLKTRILSNESKKNEDIYRNKQRRMREIGLDIDTHNYIGENVFNLTELCLTYNGKRYYLFFDYTTATWVRAEELKTIFKSNLYPYISWATHEDEYNFLSKAPADDIRPIAESMKIVFNQALDNLQKRNWGQKAYDKDIFPNPEQLEWRPNGLITAETNDKRPIASGIYEFQTPDNTTITVNLMNYLDNFLGQKTGITPSAQGVTDKDAKVGIYFGDLQQTADRLGLYNKMYAEAWSDLGARYLWGLREHMREGMLVKLIGADGIEWDELNKKDLNPTKEFEIIVKGGNAEEQIDEIKKKTKQESLSAIITNPLYARTLSPRWVVENVLRNGGWEDQDIKVALDLQNEGNQEILSEAAQAIQDILEGKAPGLNRQANAAFVQKIVDFATDNNVSMPVYTMLMQYAKAHLQIAMENTARKARMMTMFQSMNGGMPAENQGMTATPERTPLPQSNPNTLPTA